MILEALVDQFVQRFQYEKRASVCLWFDEREEFVRILPALHAHLGALKRPPFQLLEYDKERHHGQIWLKYSVYKAFEAAEPSERRGLRFVQHLPMPEERLDAPGKNGEPALDLLAEYRLNGVIWRIDGKRPTLFTFLRQAGVLLPQGSTEQRWLYEGGRDSLLAKYVASFIDRPRDFWTTTLTPEIARTRVIGDLDKTIFDISIEPEATWKALSDRGLSRDFVEAVRERYGFEAPTDAIVEWLRGFTTMVALTETYLGYGSPADFPFADRLPPEPLQQHHLQLLQRWLRDAEARIAWDRAIEGVERQIDLTSWAKERSGVSFGFPHLVRMRWQELQEAFEEAEPKASATAEFFAHYRDLISKEAEYSRTSHTHVGEWVLLTHLDEFIRSCDEARAAAERLDATEDLARAYVEAVPKVDLRHIRIRDDAEVSEFPTAARAADRAYADCTNTLNNMFFQKLKGGGTGDVPGLSAVTSRLEQSLWNAEGKRAAVIVDALRYDCAVRVKELLRDQEVEIEPVVAMLPTVTAVGMTALMPISGANLTVEVKGNSIHPKVNGIDMSARANRLAYLTAHGASCREIGEFESASDPPAEGAALLVVFGHDEVDSIGHGEAQTLIRHLQIEVERLARVIRKLHRWGYPRVHVITDHGFVLLDEQKLPEEVICDRDWCHLRKERFALVAASADLPVTTFPFAWDPAVRVAVPPGLAFFTAEKSFSHGGATLQEMIIPHLVSKSRVRSERRVGLEIVLPAYELMRTAVRVVLRPKVTGATATGQMLLFTETGRTLSLDVLRAEPDGRRVSVLAAGPKEIRLEPKDTEQATTLFFHTAESFRKGELLDLDIRDTETAEQFPPGGIKLSIGRDM